MRHAEKTCGIVIAGGFETPDRIFPGPGRKGIRGDSGDASRQRLGAAQPASGPAGPLGWTQDRTPCHVLASFAPDEDRAPLVLLEQVAVRYSDGPEILRDISFALAPGTLHFLVGPSGAGKSTLLRLLSLALKPSEGRFSLFGRDVAGLERRDLPAMRRRIGVVFQEFRLLEHLTAFDNVALPLRLANVREAEIRKHVGELLDWVGLGDKLEALPATLSGGQQQRVAIARAVIARPSLLLADEPTGNVDDRIALRLMYLFEELYKLGTTVLIATHNEGLVARFPHHQLHLEGGRLAQRTRLSAARP